MPKKHASQKTPAQKRALAHKHREMEQKARRARILLAILKNGTLLVVGGALAYLAMQQPGFHDWLIHLGKYEYLAALFAGGLFISTFSVGAGIILLVELSKTLPLIPLTLTAAVGAVIVDLVPYYLIRHTLHPNGTTTTPHRRHRSFSPASWVLMFLGAVIIASPLPDEIGVSLIGASRMSPSTFIALSYTLNCLGIWSLITVGTMA